MKEDIAETNKMLLSIIESSPYGIIGLQGDGTVSMCNNLILEQLGIPFKAKSIIGKELISYTRDISKLHDKLVQCFQKGRKLFNINNITISDKVLNIKGRPIHNGMMITTSDITELKETERMVLNAMFLAQENERRRLASEIHDGIGPLISTIKMNIESVKRDMNDAPEKVLKKIQSVTDLVQDVANDIRGISHALVPNALKDFGLITTLENLILKVNTSETINIQLFYSGMDTRLKPLMELGFYRITQELLNNALKYSKAKNITIQIIRHPDNITLTVEDDGIGFEKEKLATLVDSGIGLRNIKTRAIAMRGTFSIDTSLGNGVMSTIEVPL
jgi:PAS domain S-box-containing protein